MVGLDLACGLWLGKQAGTAPWHWASRVGPPLVVSKVVFWILGGSCNQG